jgi:hypothetical protein
VVQVTYTKRRDVSAKPMIDLTKAAPKPPPKAKAPAKQQQPKQLQVRAAPNGSPVTAELPEHLRIKAELVRRPLTDKQAATLDAVVQKAGDGPPDTMGLRLVLAASEIEYAAIWSIGILAKALHLSGRKAEGEAVHRVAFGCRVSRFSEMASSALKHIEQRGEP